MTHDHDTDSDHADDRIVTHPLGHCTNCGEPLNWVPCLNCDHPNGSDPVGSDD